VFPVRVEPDKLRPGKWSKTPLIKAWQNECSNDYGTLISEEWRTAWEAATHVGIACGPSNLTVIDVDDPAALLELPLRPTRIQLTQREGGRHFMYRAPLFHQGNGTGVPVKGMDIRGKGGFIVWYGLGDMVDDDIQDWPFNAPIGAELKPPAAAFEEVGTGPTTGLGGRLLEAACEAIAGATEGSRNNTLFKEAVRIAELVGGGDINAKEAATAIRHAGRECGLPASRVEPTLYSAFKTGFLQPRTLQQQALQANAKAMENSFFGKFSAIPPQPTPVFLVGGWLVANTFNIIHSRAGRGKTAIIADLVYSMKSGGEWLGHKTADPGETLWVNGDMSLGQVQRRLGYLQDMADLWHICFFDMMQAQDQLVQVCSKYKFVVFDNRSCLFKLTDANSAESWEALIDLMRRIAQAGCTVLLLTHQGKAEGNNSAFGSSAQEWLVDGVVLSINSKKVDGIEQRTLECQKEREAPMADIKFHLVFDGHLKPVVGHEEQPKHVDDGQMLKVRQEIAEEVRKAALMGCPLTSRSIRGLFKVAAGPIHVADQRGRELLQAMIADNLVGVDGVTGALSYWKE